MYKSQFKRRYTKIKRRTFGVSRGLGSRSGGTSQPSSSSSSQVRRWSDNPRDGDVRFDDNGVQRIYDGGSWLRFSF